MEKVFRRILKVSIILIITILLISSVSLAAIDVQNVDYSEKYKQWLELSDEEKEKTTMPAMYNNKVTSSSTYLSSLNNVMRVTSLLKSSLSSKYNLKDVIPENTTVKNQMQTSGCWAFAILGSLESNLALQDKQNSKTTKIYDFSERHMAYSSTRTAFLNNVINENGFTKSVGGGNNYIGNAYLTNGMGAIPESEMQFENNEDKIEISKIKNKTISTTITDSKFFARPTTTQEKENLKQTVKEHITNYGGIGAYIYGAQILSDYFNVATGAIYCDDENLCKIDHEILIIGWDDNYSKDNFNEKHKPSNNGAWIIKNSWGEKLNYSLSEIKDSLYTNNTSYCNEQGWNSAAEIPNEVVIATFKKMGYTTEQITINENTISVAIGDNGYMYISYDDVNISNNMYGITKASNSKNYDNIYQYDVLGSDNAITLKGNVGYLANVFERDSTKQEYLTKISVNTLIDMGKCKVLINPSNDSKNILDLQEVTLSEGSYETIKAGYNTIEFANPIKLTGSSFVIALKVENDTIYVPLISKIENSYYQEVELKSGKSFATTEDSIISNTWLDLTSTDINESLRGNLSIKAFTNNKIEEVSLKEIKITNAPTKIKYNTGEKFDSTGMKVTAEYTDGTKKEVSNYKVTNGDSLELEQNTVTITYTEDNITKTVTQSITVVNPVASISKIEIKTKPTKLEYTKDVDNLNLVGGIIKATYSDSTVEEISMTNKEVTATGYNKAKLGSQTITISYKEKMTTYTITVKEGKTDNVEETKEEPTLSDFKNSKANVIKACSYVYVKKDDTQYTTITISLTKIKLGDTNSQREYYYYLSGKQGETNIAENNWTKINNISKQNDGTYTATIEIDSRKLDSVNEIEKFENLYLYVKENAVLNDIKLTSTNQINIELKADVEVYLDDVKQANMDSVVDDTNKNTELKDTTTASGIIPQTGINTAIMTIVIILIGTTIIVYIKIRKMKDIM